MLMHPEIAVDQLIRIGTSQSSHSRCPHTSQLSLPPWSLPAPCTAYLRDHNPRCAASACERERSDCRHIRHAHQRDRQMDGTGRWTEQAHARVRRRNERRVCTRTMSGMSDVPDCRQVQTYGEWCLTPTGGYFTPRDGRRWLRLRREACPQHPYTPIIGVIVNTPHDKRI
jgi:hypothetical protein